MPKVYVIYSSLYIRAKNQLTDYTSRVESGLDDPDNLGHLGHFLVGQVGLICKLNYMDVTRISHVL